MEVTVVAKTEVSSIENFEVLEIYFHQWIVVFLYPKNGLLLLVEATRLGAIP